MSFTQHEPARKQIPPFPTRQMAILALCRICEPIAFMSIFPYVYFMIQDFGMSGTESEISIYAGMVTSAFAFAEFSSGVPWGRLSDRIGRKPVLLIGLVGTALSMLIFGFATNLPVALLARALGGLLNGNLGVLQTTVAEIATVKEHQARAYAIMPFVWSLGHVSERPGHTIANIFSSSILGPIIGGGLARPVSNYPKIFAKGTVWERLPYLLPNLVCTLLVLCSLTIGILFLEETHEEKKFQRDPGHDAGTWVLNKFIRCTDLRCENTANPSEVLALLCEDETPRAYRTAERIPNDPSRLDPEELLIESNAAARFRPAATKAFTRQVVLNIVAFGILAYHTITFDAMLPTLLSTKAPEIESPQLPFKFVGGYGLNNKQIGFILMTQGICSMVTTAFLFPTAVLKLGELRLFRITMVAYPILYIVTPYLVILPDRFKITGIYGLLLGKCTFATMAYPCNSMLLRNSAPSLLMFGTINGVAASTASLSRAIGPTVSGFIFAAGFKAGCAGLAWWSSAIVALTGAIISIYITDGGGRMDVADKSDEVSGTWLEGLPALIHYPLGSVIRLQSKVRRGR